MRAEPNWFTELITVIDGRCPRCLAPLGSNPQRVPLIAVTRRFPAATTPVRVCRSCIRDIRSGNEGAGQEEWPLLPARGGRRRTGAKPVSRTNLRRAYFSARLPIPTPLWNTTDDHPTQVYNALARAGADGTTGVAIAETTGLKDAVVQNTLKYLRRIDLAQRHGHNWMGRWSLTPSPRAAISMIEPAAGIPHTRFS